MQTWHLKWIIGGVLLAVALTTTFIAAYAWRESGTSANFSSIAGLWVSLIGFIITIWTLLDTQRVSREAEAAIKKAAAEAEGAVQSARRQIISALNQAKGEVRGSDREGLRDLLAEVPHAAGRSDWGQVLLCLRLASRFAERLSLAEGNADDLRTLTRYIRDKVAAGQTIVLQAQHLELLDSLDALLEKAGARSLYEPLEVDDGNNT